MTSEEQARSVQKLSIRNSDVIDFGAVSGSSNSLETRGGTGAAAGDGVREKLKLFPIRKLQVLMFVTVRIF